MADETGLHKIVGTPTVNQNNHGFIGDPTQHSVGLWGQVTRQIIKAYLGLERVKSYI